MAVTEASGWPDVDPSRLGDQARQVEQARADAAEEASGWPDFDSSSLGDQARRVAGAEVPNGPYDGTAATDKPSGSGWYVITDESGNVYSPEAEAANSELAELGMGLASTEKDVGSSGWYAVVDEGGRAYSPEAEALDSALAGLP